MRRNSQPSTGDGTDTPNCNVNRLLKVEEKSYNEILCKVTNNFSNRK
jgi:hypothetical protein